MKTKNKMKILFAMIIAMVLVEQTSFAQKWDEGWSQINGSAQNLLGTASGNIPAKQDLIIGTMSTPFMWLKGGTGTNLGWLGLGTASPASVFHISSTITGEVFRTDCPITNSAYWRMLRGGVERAIISSPVLSAAGGTNDIVIENRQKGAILFGTALINRMIILDGPNPNAQTGFVGIGNNFFAPQSQLHLNDGIFGTYAQITNAATGATASNGLKVGIDATGTSTLSDQRYETALKKYDSLDYSGSKALLESYLTSYPEDYNALYYCATSNYFLKNYDKAITYFTKVAKKKDFIFFDTSQWYLALSYIGNKDNTKAEKILNEIVAAGGSFKTQAETKLKEIKK